MLMVKWIFRRGGWVKHGLFCRPGQVICGNNPLSFLNAGIIALGCHVYLVLVFKAGSHIVQPRLILNSQLSCFNLVKYLATMWILSFLKLVFKSLAYFLLDRIYIYMDLYRHVYYIYSQCYFTLLMRPLDEQLPVLKQSKKIN